MAAIPKRLWCDSTLEKLVGNDSWVSKVEPRKPVEASAAPGFTSDVVFSVLSTPSAVGQLRARFPPFIFGTSSSCSVMARAGVIDIGAPFQVC